VDSHFTAKSLPKSSPFLLLHFALITWIITPYHVGNLLTSSWRFLSLRDLDYLLTRSPSFYTVPRRLDFPTVLIVIFIPSSSLRYLQAINNQPLLVPAAAAAFTTTIVALAVVRAYNP